MRLLGVPALLIVLLLGVAGCGDDDDEGRALVDDTERQALGAVDGVLHTIAERAGARFVEGNRFFVSCGEAYARRGVILQSFLRLSPATGMAPQEAADHAAAVLVEDGWKIDRSAKTTVVEGAKGELRLKAEFGTAATVVDLATDCLETSEKVAKDYHGREAEVEWK